MIFDTHGEVKGLKTSCYGQWKGLKSLEYSSLRAYGNPGKSRDEIFENPGIGILKKIPGCRRGLVTGYLKVPRKLCWNVNFLSGNMATTTKSTLPPQELNSNLLLGGLVGILYSWNIWTDLVEKFSPKHNTVKVFTNFSKVERQMLKSILVAHTI